MGKTNAQVGINFGALIATVIKDEACLIEYDSVDFQPEFKEKNLFCVAMGSGQMIAEPFLAFVKRVLWQDKMPTVDQAKLGVYWSLDHTIRLAPGGVGHPIRIATLKKGSGGWSADSSSSNQEASEWVSELELKIGNFANHPFQSQNPTPPPAAPV